jgi:hypothetical protein
VEALAKVDVASSKNYPHFLISFHKTLKIIKFILMLGLLLSLPLLSSQESGTVTVPVPAPVVKTTLFLFSAQQ